MQTKSIVEAKVADEVWIMTALLHREHPGRDDFTTNEIMERVERENLTGKLRPGVYAHVVHHCVANRAPNSGRYRMLYETAPGHRRLFRIGDSYDSGREGSKTTPDAEDLPEKYSELLDWYRGWSQDSIEERIKNDPLLALYGDGKDLWADESADDYVRRLREGWE
jgi:hypothetical protein